MASVCRDHRRFHHLDSAAYPGDQTPPGQDSHYRVFSIFIVSNIGGALTPVGDPPLFLGYLHGVPFFWTLNLFPVYLLNITILLGVYYGFDLRQYNKEIVHPDNPIPGQGNPVEFDATDPIQILGQKNMFFLGGRHFCRDYRRGLGKASRFL